MTQNQREKVTSGAPYDVAYGRTPEKALMGVLSLQPVFGTREAYYLGERPEFMDVTADWRFLEHDWSQYDEGESAIASMSEGPKYHRRLRAETADPRWTITLSNVWLEVEFHDDERANVKFKFSIQLRESELEGESRMCEGDHHWRCERMSTEPIDESRR